MPGQTAIAKNAACRWAFLIPCVLLWPLAGCSSKPPNGGPKTLPEVSDGTSANLQDTEVLPTLNTRIPKSKNAIWCAAFQIAWDHLATDVLKSPVQIAGAESLCQELNAARFDPSRIPAQDYYATAGLVGDGVTERIRQQMQTQFPTASPPMLPSDANAIVAYAYLHAGLKFDLPYFECDQALEFEDATSSKTPVAAFGIRHEDDYAYMELRKQVDVLYADFDLDDLQDGYRGASYAVDLCRTSTPYQVVVACIPAQDTLFATLADLEQRITAARHDRPTDSIGPNDVLLVPSQAWRIAHHFTDLEGRERRCLNEGFTGYYVSEAMQVLEFRLDRGGVELAAEAKTLVLPVPRYFIFDRPFLLYLKMRGAAQPFFVMWVNNAELLTLFDAAKAAARSCSRPSPPQSTSRPDRSPREPSQIVPP